MTVRRVIQSLAGAFIVAGAMLVLPAGATAAPAGARVYIRVGPPRPLVERRVVAPGPGFVWLPGFYAWNGSAYIWTAGRWERPPRPRARWIAGHYVHERRGWYFIEGHWR